MRGSHPCPPILSTNGEAVVPTSIYSWNDLTSPSDNTTCWNLMTPQSKTMKNSIGEGGNSGKVNELARLSQLNNELLAQVAALKKEKLTWSSGSRNDTSASNLVEMPLPHAWWRLVHSFVVTLGG